MAEPQRQTFWGWISDNPIAAIMVLITILGVVALLVGYREGFMAIMTGLFGKLQGDDASNKLRKKELEVSRTTTDHQFAELNNMIESSKVIQEEHDKEVKKDVETAKAFCDDMDVDELVDIGNSMLRDHGAFGGAQS